MLGPAEHAGLEEGAVDDQLRAAVEQVEQARLALRPVECVLLLHGQPRLPPAFGGQRVTGAGQGLLLHEELLARSLPLLLRHGRGCVYREMPFRVFVVSLVACCHTFFSLFRYNSVVVGHELNLTRNVEMMGVTSVAGFRWTR